MKNATITEASKEIYVNAPKNERTKLEPTKNNQIEYSYIDRVVSYVRASYALDINPLGPLRLKGWKAEFTPAYKRSAGKSALIELFQVAQVGDNYYSIEMSIEL